MTDARDRLAQVLEELSDAIHATVLARDAADAIAAFVEERIGQRDARVFGRLREVESDDMATAKALDALTQRLEALEQQVGLSGFSARNYGEIRPNPTVQPAPAACEWWLVLAGDGDVLEVFAFEDDAHRWATEQDAAIVDGPPHCVVRVVSAGSEPVAEREQPAPAPTFPSEAAVNAAELAGGDMARRARPRDDTVAHHPVLGPFPRMRHKLATAYAIDRPAIERAAYERGVRELAKWLAFDRPGVVDEFLRERLELGLPEEKP